MQPDTVTKLRRWGATVHLVWAIIAAVAFVAILIVLDLVVDDFDPLKDTISAHANGDGGWAINLAFVIGGLSLLPAGYPVHWHMKGKHERRTVMALFGLGGLCVAGLAAFPTDRAGESTTTGIIHLALAATGITLVMVGAIMGSVRFAQAKDWPVGGFVSSWISGIITGTFVVVAIILAIVAFQDAHPIESALGLLERAVVFAELLWVTQMVGRVRSVLYKQGGDLVEGENGLEMAAVPQ